MRADAQSSGDVHQQVNTYKRTSNPRVGGEQVPRKPRAIGGRTEGGGLARKSDLTQSLTGWSRGVAFAMILLMFFAHDFDDWNLPLRHLVLFASSLLGILGGGATGHGHHPDLADGPEPIAPVGAPFAR